MAKENQTSRWILRAGIAFPLIINLLLFFIAARSLNFESENLLLYLSFLQYIYGAPLFLFFYQKKWKSWYMGLAVGLIAFNLIAIAVMFT
ncbi:hypothetical protein ACIGEL_19300 [Rossellomorea aquimaris]|uniref:hypothetical protein n=1 Tax=Rossellomorea aquimaris TaxID=189382 RepID=UPI0037CA41BC